MAGADVVSAETMSHGTPVVARRARAASVGSWGDWRGRSPLSLSGTPAGQSGGSLSVPASNECSEREASADVWPLALRGPMTGTHGVCINDVLQRRSSSLRKERSRRVARASLAGEGGTGCAVLGRAAEVARVRVAPREVTGIVQPGRPSVLPDTPA